MGGPTIGWSSGRTDAMDPSAVTPDGRLPNADVGKAGAEPSDAGHLRDIFYRMGFDDREIVALSGAHALGRCHPTASGFDGPWTFTPTTFNNQYFVLLKSIPWKEREWSGPFQYEDSSGKLMMLATDLVLIQDKSFKKYVDKYAKDDSMFQKDFAAAFQKLEELGTSGLNPTAYA
uniref:Plant heme peroxidase family profile domain-containing protein n=1 Tax=Corethron hystrix TaxID=216773 RepID=A0A7S1BRL8_9STRA